MRKKYREHKKGYFPNHLCQIAYKYQNPANEISWIRKEDKNTTLSKVLLATLLAIGLTFTPFGNMLGGNTSYVLGTTYDRTVTTGNGYREPTPIEDKDSLSGPGAEIWNEEDAKLPERMMELIDGPSVTQVTLQEKYHEDYKIYEESMGDAFFFYTNVSNGGITHENVILDIPQNMYCTLEKDGMILDYIPGQEISGYGSYVVRVTAIQNESVPFSEQTEYRAIFRFRIQEKPPEEETEGSEGISSFSGISSGLGSSSTLEESLPWQLNEESDSATGEVEANSESEENTEVTEEAESSQESGEVQGNGEGETESSEESEENPEGTTKTLENREVENQAQPSTMQAGSWGNSYKLRTQTYDMDMRRYKSTFENGRTLVSNIPEGYIGPGAVELSISEGEEVHLYRNDEETEYIPGNSLTEPGYYHMDIDGQMWSFAIASSVGQMDYYPAPAGMEFTQASFEGEPLEILSGHYLPMEKDGLYQIAMRGEAGDGVEVTLRKDTIAPEVIVTVKGGKADIQYLADDITDIVLEKDGEIQEGFSGYTVNSPGAYKLMVSDAAGNVSSSEFILKYHVNVYGIMAFVLGALLIAGGIIFVIHIKRTVKVR